ncbi:MAG: ABC-F family ATP-binding cassette domain-containing protein [Deltaproteobacteria bacterium]|nr:ABC-F family ATP-binding cassette domain-containing protein [Deltaproteobacteria bacterium]
MLLRAESLARTFGDRRLFADVTLEVHAGDRLGIVGPNGAGKTTLLRLLAGEEEPDGGRVVAARGVRIGRLRQEVDPTIERPVREEAARALGHLDALEAEWRRLEERMVEHGRRGEDPPPELAARYDALRARFALAEGFSREARVARVLAGLGFDEEAAGRPVRAFSGGWLMRVELAKLLLSEPEVLLLDEPTNHLDLPAIEWLEGFLAGWRGAVVSVSHDRTYLRRHVARIAELAGGTMAVYAGNWDRYQEAKAERREQDEARRENEARRRAEVERFVERFRYKASKARQAQSRIKLLERMARDATPEAAREGPRLRLRIPAPPRTGDPVVTLEGVEQGYGDTRVYRGLEFRVRRGERVALVGPNGAGKSTLLRIVAGVVPIDRGVRKLGHEARVAFYAQHQLESLDPERSVLGELERAARLQDAPRLRGHLGALLFSGDDVEKPVAVLSGGEKARLALAKLLLRPASLLVMDEPTNHLDVAACEVLEEALAGSEGTLLFVSHDRSFVNAVATRVVEVRQGQLREFSGNYDDYLRALDPTTAAPEVAAARSRAQGGHPASAAAGGGGAARSEPKASAAHQEAPEARHRHRKDAFEGRPSDPPASPRVEGGAPVSPPPSPAEARRQARDRRRAEEKAARHLARLETRIGACEKTLEELAWRRADPAVLRDGERARALDAEHGALRAELDALYAEWETWAAALEDARPDAGGPR